MHVDKFLAEGVPCGVELSKTPHVVMNLLNNYKK